LIGVEKRNTTKSSGVTSWCPTTKRIALKVVRGALLKLRLLSYALAAIIVRR
jgi:hypothetical protein